MRRRQALVLGLGRFGGGLAATRHLCRNGFRVRVADRATAGQLPEAAAALEPVSGVELCLGREDADLLAGIDLLVCNPAVPEGHPLLQAARRAGIPLSQEANLFLEAYPGRVVLVTGTDGKSSTAALLAAALRRSGVDTLLGGNIGHSLLEERERWRRTQIAVLEISSFQLERVDPARHRVAAAVYTPVTRDHIDRHGSLSAYRAAKARAAAMAGDCVVLPEADQVVRGFHHGAAETVLYGGGPEAEVVVTDDWVRARTGPDPGVVLGTAALSLIGRFQAHNAAAAWAAASRLGASRHTSGLGLATCPPLPHRLQWLASVDGVRVIDNAVSTTLDSTLSALESLRGPIHWVGGGIGKDGASPPPVRQLGALVRSAHLFGRAAAEFGPRLADCASTTCHADLEEALAAAWTQSRAGDTILFSPGFASYDQFANFRERAARFRAWVRQLQVRGAPGHRSTPPTAAGGAAAPG